MEQIRLKDFRCFRERQTAGLAPLTLLVGENSTGKTSFMALIRTLWDAAYRWQIPDFKDAPYDLGSFDEIAHYRGGRGGRAAAVEAGFDADPAGVGNRGRENTGGSFCRFDVTFERKGSAPVPVRWALAHGDVAIEERLRADMSRQVRFQTARGVWRSRPPAEFGPRGSTEGPVVFLFMPLSARLKDWSIEPLSGSPPITSEDLGEFERLILESGFAGGLATPRPFASAPVRSKPRRTYDPSRPVRDPEGETIPMYLSTTFFEKRGSWDTLKKALEEFGRNAGLFDEISVKPLGKRGSEPFQMHVRKRGKRAKGPMRNLIDVGYGVSQVLPVITELFRDDATPMFLLQQPEVHLHPSAQAALGSLFCTIAARNRQLVVETHSDHLLDRVRMDVRDGRTNLTPDDVSILFFERGDLDVRIHSLRLDGEGNVLDAPPNYRRFFMDETRRSLRL